MDEVEIFDRSLSTAEIQVIYNEGSVGKCKPTPTITPTTIPTNTPTDSAGRDGDSDGHAGATSTPTATATPLPTNTPRLTNTPRPGKPTRTPIP